MATFIAIFVALLVLVIVAKLVWKFIKLVVVCALVAALGFIAVTHADDIQAAVPTLQTQLAELTQ